MPLLKSILKLLADGQIHSKEEIGHFLGMPSNVFSVLLERLVDQNVDLETFESQGYCIPGGLELLEEKLIISTLGNTRSLLNNLEILSSIDSTNSYLLKKLDSQTCAVFAEQQTCGRGQFDRPWLSRLGKNIAVSILWHVSNDPNKLMGLSLVIGLAVVQALEEYGLQGIQLKWPNDLVHQGKKLAGILIETRPFKSKLSVVIGIGLNIYKPTDDPHILGQAVTDICSIHKVPPQRNRLAGLLLKNSLMALSHFQAKGLGPFLKKLNLIDHLSDQAICIKTTTAGTLAGIARGINAYGQLLVEINGKEHCFHSGEIHINQNNFSEPHRHARAMPHHI